MKIVNKKYIILGIMVSIICLGFAIIVWQQTNLGGVGFGILSLIIFIGTLDYLINPDIKADKNGIKIHHKKINWNEIKYFDNYPHTNFEEWLEENYNLCANDLDKNGLENYNNEFRNSCKGIYVGLKNEEIRMDVNLNLSDVEKIEIVDKLNSMKIKY